MRLATLASFLFLPFAVTACTDATDTAPDAGAPATPELSSCGAPETFQIDAVELPDAHATLVSQSLDLDGDGAPDDALAGLMWTLSAVDPDVRLSSVVSGRLTSGEVTWRISLASCDRGTRVELGDAGGGNAVPVGALVDPLGTFVPVAWIEPTLVAAQMTISGDSATGTIGFALPMPASEDALLAPAAVYLSGELAAGRSPLAAEIDADHDGVITVAEAEASPYFRTILWPDLHTPAPALSAGFFVHAHRVAP